MLCERCHQREAIVHVTSVVGPSGEMTKQDFCESCFREIDIEHGIANGGWTNYEPPRATEGNE
jgi:protein-arginine kinase activator protein McsA